MTEPIGYLNYGWSYLRAAEELHERCVREEIKIAFPDAPVVMLAGHALELMLKAYIWNRTGKEADRTHDLAALMKKAQELGLNLSFSERPVQLLDELNAVVGRPPYKARYLETGVATMPPIGDWFALARNAMDNIEPVLAQSRVQNVGLRTKREPSPLIST